MKQYCTFIIDQKLFAINVEAIQEVIDLPQLSTIPRAKDFVTGIFSLRGQIITNICISTLLHMKNKSSSQHCIVLNTQPDPTSLNVFEVLDIIDVEDTQIEACPDIIPENVKQYLGGIIRDNEQIITILNIESIKH